MTMSNAGRSIQAAALIAALTVCAAVLPARAQVAADFESIKAAAAKEGRITVWHNTPNHKTTEALTELFNKRFGMNIKVDRISVSGSVMTSRLMTEKRGGKITVDVFIANDRHLPLLVKNKLIEKTDWVGLFAGPGKMDEAAVKSASNNMIPAYIGYGLEFRHDVFGFAYNTKALTEETVPKNWADMADPKWRNKVAIDVGLSPLARLVPAIGRDGVIDLAKKMVANRPIYGDGQPAAVNKVVSGEAAYGAVSLTSALEEVGKGAPIGLVFPEPQALISQLVMYTPANSPHPNLAKMWAAWITSEGMSTAPMLDEGILRAWPNSPGPFGEYFTKHNLQVRRAGSIEELEETNTIRKDLEAIAGGAK